MAYFLLTFFLVYGGAHLYAFVRIRALLPAGRFSALALAFFMAFMVAAPVLVRLGERAGLEGFPRVLAWICFLWMGALFLFVSASALLDAWRLPVLFLQAASRRDLGFLLPASGRAARVLIVLTAALTAYSLLEAWRVRPETVTVLTEKIAAAEPPVTIVQISDVHVGLIVGERRLRRILQVVKGAKPDLLVSTGDLVDGQINDIGRLAELFGGIKPKYGMFAVTGNHEYYAGIDQALAFTRRAGFTVLRDESLPLGNVLTLAGVDDRRGNRRQAAFDEAGVVRSAPAGRFTVLLKHRPLVNEEACGLVDLQLSGHTHRGQIFPFGLLTKLFFPLNSGTVRLPGGCLLHISRGSGTWGPPMRFLSRPEVTVIRLVGAS